MNTKRNIASLLTPVGRGAIAIVNVEGDDAVKIVDSHFRSASHRSLLRSPVGKILFGNWNAADLPLGTEGPNPGEELVVCQVGKDRVEISCHGGVVAPKTILDSLRASGCEIVEWQSLDLGFDDPLAHAAAVELSKATTRKTASILLDQFHGALRMEIASIIKSMEDREFAKRRLQQLLDFSDLGLHLTTPWRIVIAGPTNVGKSSLMNALLGFERAIVYPEPGTTRDVVTATTAFDGWPVELSDTAGIRQTTDEIEVTGIELARREIDEADLVIQLMDARDENFSSMAVTDSKNQIFVRNKADLLDEHARHEPTHRYISAKYKTGVQDLIQQIVAKLIPIEPGRKQPIPFTEGQIESIRDALTSLENDNTDGAKRLLLSLS